MDSARLAARHRAEAPRRRRAASWLRRRLDLPGQAVSALLVAAESAALIGLLWLLALTLAAIVHAGGASPGLLHALVALGLLALARAVLHTLGEVYHTRQALTVTTRLRRQWLPAAMQPQWRLRHNAGPAHLATRLGRELDSLQPWYASYRPALLGALIQPVLILAVVFAHDWLAGALLLLAAPLIPLFMALIGMGVSALAEDQHRRLARLGDLFLDRLQALPLLRITRQTETAAEEVEAAAHGWREAAMRVLRVAFLSTAVLEFFAAVAIATVAIYVGMALLGYISFGPAPQMTLASGLVILVLAPEFFAPLRLLGQRYHDRATALAAAAGLEEEFSTARQPTTEPTIAHWSAPPAIHLHALTLRPPGSDHPLPLHITLDIAAGEWIAITGPSGCGKTTLAHTLLGFHPPHAGQLGIDERKLADIAPSELRRNTNWLGQHAPLLAASLRRNIAPGDSAPTAQRLHEAARAAGLADIIAALPHGMDTRLGEDGAGLSGGERRRVALARALYTRPRLLVLDEPTAGLDPHTEASVLDTLHQLAGDCTIIMFTHSEAAANAADRRFALDGAAL